MNPHQRATKALLLCLGLILLVVSDSRCVFGRAGQEWGKPENGLQLSLFPVNASPASLAGFGFRVEIRNVGSKDLLIELGLLLANGQKQYPNALSVLITTPKGETLECGYPGPLGFAGGKADPLIVPLPAQASFVLPVDFEKWTGNLTYCFAPQADIPLNMPSGQYAFRVRYAAKVQKDLYFGPYGGLLAATPPGAPSSTVAIQWAGQIIFPVWVGTAASNQLKFELPPRPSAK